MVTTVEIQKRRTLTKKSRILPDVLAQCFEVTLRNLAGIVFKQGDFGNINKLKPRLCYFLLSCRCGFDFSNRCDLHQKCICSKSKIFIPEASRCVQNFCDYSFKGFLNYADEHSESDDVV